MPGPLVKRHDPCQGRELALFESEQPSVQLVYVDVDRADSEPYKRHFRSRYRGRTLPFTVLVSSSGEAVRSWTGYFPYSTMARDILTLEATER